MTTRYRFLPARVLAWTAVLLAGALHAAPRPNILFIAVDDLNHWVGHLGRNPQARTPNIDRLAAMGVTFTRAYCAAPVCNPSRAALLSGRRPGTTGVYDNQNPYTGVIQPAESLVTQFKNAGYETLGMGKLWHGGLGWPGQWTDTGGRERAASARVDDRSIGPIKFGIVEGGDEAVGDTAIADYGIAQLGRRREKPFFLVLGFHKPHMPWNVPQKYFDLHPLDKIQLPPHRTNDLDDLPPAGVKMAGAFGDHAKVLASGRWKEAVQAYLAAISYLDGQLGRVLDALEKSPHGTNTIVCFWGDHGWHLGEKSHWRKFALWEEATRAPLLWVVPGVTRPGGRCERAVDFMSIYPTLCDLAGVPAPKHVEGASLRPLLADPKAAWDKPAVTTHGRNNHALRTERWRYIRYADGGEELYDHRADPYEWTNLATRAEHALLKKELAAQLPSVNQPPVPRGAGRNAPE
jgi:arylsulfatase A-like enzyme